MNNLSLDNLYTIRQSIVSKMEPMQIELDNIDKQIHLHSEFIKNEFFGSLIGHGVLTEKSTYTNEILSRIQHAEEIDGIMETRKDRIPWDGVKFTIDDIEYWYRSGYDGNSYTFHDCGVYGDEQYPDLYQDIAYRIWYKKDTYENVDDVFDGLNLEPHIIVGYLLYAMEV